LVREGREQRKTKIGQEDGLGERRMKSNKIEGAWTAAGGGSLRYENMETERKPTHDLGRLRLRGRSRADPAIVKCGRPPPLPRLELGAAEPVVNRPFSASLLADCVGSMGSPVGILPFRAIFAVPSGGQEVGPCVPKS